MTKVLHVLDHSMPQQSGYSSRSHAILKALLAKGLNIAALTSPKHGPVDQNEQQVDNVHYYRSVLTGNGNRQGASEQVHTILATRAAIRHYKKRNGVDILHAHSPCLNGLAVMGQGVPFV